MGRGVGGRGPLCGADRHLPFSPAWPQGYYDNPKVCALYIMAGTVDGELFSVCFWTWADGCGSENPRGIIQLLNILKTITQSQTGGARGREAGDGA